jgi:hypothetical protein
MTLEQLKLKHKQDKLTFTNSLQEQQTKLQQHSQQLKQSQQDNKQLA